MIKLVDELYDELDVIFKDHTTHNWKNGWQNEGDRESTELTVQKMVPDNNMFLLQYGQDGNGSFKLTTSTSINISASLRNSGGGKVRFDISFAPKQRIYYSISKNQWGGHKLFIIELCIETYNNMVKQREMFDKLPKELYGTTDPEFFKQYNRKHALDKLLK